MIRRYTLLALLSTLAIACTSDMDMEMSADVTTETDSSLYKERTDAIEGRLAVKVSPEMAEKLESAVVTKTSVEQVLEGDNIASLGITSMSRIFPYAGKFEERTRAEGLHLWYNVEFDASCTNTRAAYSLLDVEGITFVEDRATPVLRNTGKLIPYSASNSRATRSDESDLIFNDTRLYDQWNYTNRANLDGFIAGVDVNIEPLWRSGITGNSSIIIGVVDGGADWTHPDLIENLYVNEAELNGTPNFDDDGNGYIDDAYGFNFVSNNTTIIAHDHGTHVSGTIAAVNNNGISVCGIAGGDGTPNSGVKLLGCQIFESTSSGTDNVGDGATAIKYSCDSGAIISQNSWGYTTSDISEADQAAIDYFIKYAGIDENGNQVGPMKGGIVVFAAGNNDVMYANPGAYEGAICVTALSPDGKRAPYSNYGDFADIAAPGGEQVRWELYESGVLSTIPMNKYQDNVGNYADCGYFAGTSMACPHVSGIIALYLARQIELGQTDGLTPDVIKERLFSTARTLVELEPEYYKYLGHGLVDASRFVGIESTTTPSAVTDFAVAQAHYTSFDMEWSLPSNAKGFTIYYSEASLEGLDADNLPSDVYSLDVSKGASASGLITFSVSDLMPSTKYYMAIRSWDYADNYSELSSVVSATTSANQSPLFYLNGEQITLDSFSVSPEQTLKMTYTIADPDGDKVIYEYTAGSGAESALYNDDTQTITLFITGSKATDGTYTALFKASDIYGGESQMSVEYVVVPNDAPVAVQAIDDVTFDEVNKQRTISLTRYFEDPDSDAALTFSASSSDSSIVSCEIEDSSTLLLTSKGYGVATITVTATDQIGDSVSTTFIVMCGNDSDYSVTLYPNPVSTTLNIKCEALSLEKVVIYNANGVALLTSTDLDERKVDVSSLSSGVYSVDVVVAGESNLSNITKL